MPISTNHKTFTHSEPRNCNNYWKIGCYSHGIRLAASITGVEAISLSDSYFDLERRLLHRRRAYLET